MSVTYTATLAVRDETLEVLTRLLDAERARRGTRQETRALTCREQAILVLRWFLDGVSIDGTLIETDRVATVGPTPGVDLWWSGKHANHGGNVQVITVPDGWPIWTSPVRPGREHDTTCLRTHTEILPALRTAAADLPTLGDLGYEGEADTITIAFKKPKQGVLSGEHQQFNKAHNGVRAIGERGNSLLKTTFKALRNVSLNPYRIGAIVAAALVILHIDHARTT